MRYAINEEIKFAMAIERAKMIFERKFRLNLIQSFFKKNRIYLPLRRCKNNTETCIRTPLPEPKWIGGVV